MKNYFSKILAVFLIPGVALAAVLCCDMSGMKTAEASHPSAVAKAEKLPPCHAQKKETQSSGQGNCNCCKEKKLQTDLPAQISSLVSKVIIGYVSLNIFAQQSPVIKDEFSLAYLNGPPGPVSDVPLYISFHNFRI